MQLSGVSLSKDREEGKKMEEEWRGVRERMETRKREEVRGSRGLPLNYKSVILILNFLSISPLSSVQFSRSVMSDSLRPHESQHARPPCPSPTPRVHSDLRPSSQ